MIDVTDDPIRLHGLPARIDTVRHQLRNCRLKFCSVSLLQLNPAFSRLRACPNTSATMRRSRVSRHLTGWFAKMTRLIIAAPCYAVLHATAFALAVLLRLDFEWDPYGAELFASAGLWVVLMRVTTFLVSRDYRRRMRYSTTYDVAFSFCVCLAGGILIAASQLFHEAVPNIPRSIIAIDTVLCACMVSGARIGIRMMQDQVAAMGQPRAQKAVIFSEGPEANGLLSAVRGNSSSLRVVGMIATEVSRPGTLLSGIPVFSHAAGVADTLARLRARHLLVSSAIRGQVIRQLAEECAAVGAEVHLIPAVDEITQGKYQLRLRDVTIDDLLRREPNQLDMDGIRELVDDKVVLVTGAAGSIGSEVSRQLMQLRPKQVVLLDQSEFGIFELQQEFARTLGNDCMIRTEFVLEDIADRESMQRLFLQYRPQVVFHAAAYKHVPLMEENPQAAVRNNVFGTRTLVELSDRMSVERFVMISTDKAVRPTNIMGATKLIAERCLHDVAERSATRFITVRFGNVLNSAGSVVPTFRRQIENGGPVTVTHPKMERYFMTIPEAVQLVLQAAALGDGGDVLILDMGEPVRIVDLARDMITLSGRRYPDDIDIVFTGLRPGEKLYEELFYESEQSAVRVHEKIFRAPRASDEHGFVTDDMRMLERHLHGSRTELAEVVRRIAARVADESSRTDETRRAA